MDCCPKHFGRKYISGLTTLHSNHLHRLHNVIGLNFGGLVMNFQICPSLLCKNLVLHLMNNTALLLTGPSGHTGLRWCCSWSLSVHTSPVPLPSVPLTSLPDQHVADIVSLYNVHMSINATYICTTVQTTSHLHIDIHTYISQYTLQQMV